MKRYFDTAKKCARVRLLCQTRLGSESAKDKMSKCFELMQDIVSCIFVVSLPL